jgi:hypothetical protein
MEHGKVALVASQDAATQQWFESALARQLQAELGCEVVHLQARDDEDALKMFNDVLSKVSLQQATQPNNEEHGNLVFWLSESEDFTPERFQLIKDIILQLAGLRLKLFVSVTSDRWSRGLFDIAGRKIAYWYIPADPPAPAVIGLAPAELNKGDDGPMQMPSVGGQVSAPMSASKSRQPRVKIWLPFIGILVLLGAGTLWLDDQSDLWHIGYPFGSPKRVAQDPIDQAKQARSESEPLDASSSSPDTKKPSGEAGVLNSDSGTSALERESSALSPAQTPVPSVKTTVEAKANAAFTPPQAATTSPEPALKIPTSPAVPPAAPTDADAATVNMQADCPSVTAPMPVAKPASFVKDTNYIYVKSNQTRKICVAAAGGPFRVVSLQANKGSRVYGNAPWRVYSPDLRKVELYFQGAIVVLDARVDDRVEVNPR